MSERILSVLLSVIFGGALGSFANVLIIRWHDSVSIKGRSICPHCRMQLKARHLVPVLSWLFLRGECATCGKKIHIQYPLVEAAAIMLSVIAVLRHSPLTDPFTFLFEVIVSVGLLVPVVMDLRWKEIPVEYVAGLGLLAASYHLLLGNASIASIGLAGIGASAFFFIQRFVSRGRWVGAGDAWFGATMGAILATPAATALALYLSYLIGGGAALIGLLLGVFQRKHRLPFAPALTAGTLVTLWYGKTILTWVEHIYGRI